MGSQLKYYSANYGGLYGVAVKNNSPDGIPIQWFTKLNDGTKIAFAYEGGYTKMQVEGNNQPRYYAGLIREFDKSKWSTYNLGAPSNAYDFRVKGKLFNESGNVGKLGILVGDAINHGNPKNIETIRKLNDGTLVYMLFEDNFTKMVTEKNDARYYGGPISNFNPNNWDSYTKLTNHPYAYMLIYGTQFDETSSNQKDTTSGSNPTSNPTSKPTSNPDSNNVSPPKVEAEDGSNMLFYIMIIGGIVCFVFILILILIL
jgi:hypothetical protein